MDHYTVSDHCHSGLQQMWQKLHVIANAQGNCLTFNPYSSTVRPHKKN